MVEKSEVLTAVFISTAIISTISLIGPTINYVEFYRSLERFVFEINSIALNLTNLQNGEVTINIEFNATNHSGFIGLELAIITCRLHYYEGTDSILLMGKTEAFSPPIFLEPYDITPVSVDLKINWLSATNPDVIRNFLNLLQSNPEKINWVSEGQCVLYALTYSFPMNYVLPYESNLRP